jgi:hypothetical protein
MAKIKICGDAAVLTSAVTVKDIKTLSKFKPNALKLIDPETKDELYAIGMGSTASLSKFGATFTGEDARGCATATIALPIGIENEKKKEYTKDSFGYALLSLQKVEAQIVEVMATTRAEFENMDDAIELA